jgi:hypothetical protein
MKEDQDYIRNIAEIRSMMERSSKFLSLSGWAGIMAGMYALAGAYLAHTLFDFNPAELVYDPAQAGSLPSSLLNVILLAMLVLLLAIGTAIILSARKANKRGETLWNATSRRLMINMAVPLSAGGLLILVFISKGLMAFIAPFTLVFYGLALYNASKFTYEEVKSLGLIQIGLGLVGAYFVDYGLLLWALGFGVFHIIYGIYMHYRYER